MKKLRPLIFKALMALAFTPSMIYPLNAMEQDDLPTLSSSSKQGIIPSKDQSRRIASLKRDARQRRLKHVPLMFVSMQDVKKHYAEDVEKAKEFDAKFEKSSFKKSLNKKRSHSQIKQGEDLELTGDDHTPPKKYKRLRRTGDIKEVPSSLTDRILDEDECEDTTQSLSATPSSSNLPFLDEKEILTNLDDHDVITFHKDGSVSSQSITQDSKSKLWFTEPNKKRKAPLYRSSQSYKKARTSAHTNAAFRADFEGTEIFYDTETTTLSPKCGGRLCEIAAIKVINGIPRETLHIFLNPDMKSWDGAFKAHGLHESFLRVQAHFYDVARTIEEFFGDHMRCAHNGFRFDDPYLMYEMRRSWVFYHLKKLLTPTADLGTRLPPSVHFDEAKVAQGHLLLKSMGIICDQEKGPQINSDQQANLLASAAMIYFFKDHMSQSKASNDKPGPLMFQDGQIMPDPERYPEHYEAATSRLAWFRLIRAETETYEQRQRLKLPHEKFIRDAIELAENYIKAVMELFARDIISESQFRADPLDTKKMFDTLVYVREFQDLFKRGFTIDSHRLDALIDYYGINRHAREVGNHGAGIDTNLLFQVVRKMHGYTGPDNPFLQGIYQKSQIEQENYFFQKNSLLRFDEEGKLIEKILLHNDGIESTTNQRSGQKAIQLPHSSSNTNPYRADYMPTPVAVAASLVSSKEKKPLISPWASSSKIQESQEAQAHPLSQGDKQSQRQENSGWGFWNWLRLPSFNF